MKRVKSKQVNINFIFCSSPLTIDKRSEWGNSDDNFQQGPNGAFLKVNEDGKSISHLVQPNADKSAPEGWTPNNQGTFDKLPIWVDDSKIYDNEEVKISTIDGNMTYTVTEPSVMSKILQQIF